MAPPFTQISVTRPVSQALDWTKRLLFEPFDMARWFLIAFTAWLAYLGEGGFGGRFNFPNPSAGSSPGSKPFRVDEFLAHARDYVMNNLSWLVPLAIAGFLLLVIISVAIHWVKSRGQFMFLYNVVTGKTEVAVPWREYAAEASSLFLFRMIIWSFLLVVMLPLLAFGGVLIYRMVIREAIHWPSIMILGIIFSVFLAVAFITGIIHTFTQDFVVPIMYRRRIRCLAAWREFNILLRANLNHFVIYFLFKFVLSLAVGLLMIVAFLITCCFCCIGLIPYLNTVITLPTFVFLRAYPLYYLAQFGPDYDLFSPPVLAPPAALH